MRHWSMHRLTFAALVSVACCVLSIAPKAAAWPYRMVIAPAGEPGQRMVLTGRVIGPDGSPMAGAEVYAYQTDATGLYRTDGRIPQGPSMPPRLEGRLRTSSEGLYQVETIKPAPYPSRNNPAHIHFRFHAPGVPDQFVTVWFEGDPLITPEHRAKHADAIIPLSRDEQGVLRGRHDFQLSAHPKPDD